MSNDARISVAGSWPALSSDSHVRDSGVWKPLGQLWVMHGGTWMLLKDWIVPTTPVPSVSITQQVSRLPDYVALVQWNNSLGPAEAHASEWQVTVAWYQNGAHVQTDVVPADDNRCESPAFNDGDYVKADVAYFSSAEGPITTTAEIMLSN